MITLEVAPPTAAAAAKAAADATIHFNLSSNSVTRSWHHRGRCAALSQEGSSQIERCMGSSVQIVKGIFVWHMQGIPMYVAYVGVGNEMFLKNCH